MNSQVENSSSAPPPGAAAPEGAIKEQTRAQVRDLEQSVELDNLSRKLEKKDEAVQGLPVRFQTALKNFDIPEVFNLIFKALWNKAALNPEKIDETLTEELKGLSDGEKSRTALALEDSLKPDPSGSFHYRFVAAHLKFKIEDQMWGQGYRAETLAASNHIDVSEITNTTQLVMAAFDQVNSEDQALQKVVDIEKTGVVFPRYPFSGRLYFGQHQGEPYLIGASPGTEHPPPAEVASRLLLPGYPLAKNSKEIFTAHLEPGDLVMECLTDSLSKAQTNAQEGFPCSHILVWDGENFVHLDGPKRGIRSDSMDEWLASRKNAKSNQGLYVTVLKNPIQNLAGLSSEQKNEKTTDFLRILRADIGKKSNYEAAMAKKVELEMGRIREDEVDTSRMDICTSFVQDGLTEAAGISVSDTQLPDLVDFYNSATIKWQGFVAVV